MKLTRVMWVFLIMCVLPFSVSAATIEVQVDRNPVGIDESFQMVFQTKDDPDGDPDFSPLQPLVDIINQRQSSNISIINGRYEGSKTWTLTLMPKKRGKLTLPSISFGQDKSPPYDMIVKGAVVRPEEQSAFFTRIDFDRTKLYAQQQLVVTQYIFSSTNLSSYEMGELKFSGVEVIIEPLGDVKQYTKKVGQDPFLVLEKRYAVFPLASGTMKLEPVVSGGQQSVSRGSFFLPFGGGAPRVLRARSGARQVEVLPIPATADMNPWLPVKQLELSELWSQTPLKFVVGEPVTRTLMLKAEGVTSVQLPELSEVLLDDIKQYPDQPLLNDIKNDTGITGHRVQKVAFIPTRAGEFELPAIEIPWWDIEKQSRQVARIPARTIEVMPAVGASTLPAEVDAAPSEPQTAAGDSETSPPAEEPGIDLVPEQVDAGLWPFLTLVMALGWLMTILIWVRQNRRSRSVSAPANRRKASLKKQLKALQLACKQQDASACRRELLAWAKLVFNDRDITTLRDVMGQLPADMATEIGNIDAMLYGSEQSSIDFKAISNGARRVMADMGKNDMPAVDLLEPMYR